MTKRSIANPITNALMDSDAGIPLLVRSKRVTGSLKKAHVPSQKELADADAILQEKTEVVNSLLRWSS
jgi:hypothetical protein